MLKILRQCVGIDCSKDKLDVSFGVRNAFFDDQLLSTTIFKNNSEGSQKLWDWSQKFTQKRLAVYFVIEATGVYHEQVSLYLHSKGAHISVLLPNKVKSFSKSLDTKTVTDNTN